MDVPRRRKGRQEEMARPVVRMQLAIRTFPDVAWRVLDFQDKADASDPSVWTREPKDGSVSWRHHLRAVVVRQAPIDDESRIASRVEVGPLCFVLCYRPRGRMTPRFLAWLRST